jgi:hypothetical protein
LAVQFPALRREREQYDVELARAYHQPAFEGISRAHPPPTEPVGLFSYNLTGSPEAQLTVVTVFPYAMMIGNCLAVRDSPFQIDIEPPKRVMAAYRLDGAPLVDLRNRARQERLTK